jgi:hypothetical protein
MVLHNPGRFGYFLFVIFNGLFFAASGCQVTLRFGGRHISELFFTRSSLKRALRRNDFEVEDIIRQPSRGWRASLEVFGRKVKV